MVPSLPLLSCESSVPVKENPDGKKRKIQHKKIYLRDFKSIFISAGKQKACAFPKNKQFTDIFQDF